MKLRLRDVIGYQGRDYTVEGLLTYRLAARTFQLARLVDGSQASPDFQVRWIEPLTDDLDDRVLLFQEVSDVPVSTPPPPTLSYKGGSYVPRFSGAATISSEGDIGGRMGNCEVWRYRAAGDIYIQIEKWPGRTVVLAGEAVHKDMIELFPAP